MASQSGHLNILRGDPSKLAEFSSPDLKKERLMELMTQFQNDVAAGQHSINKWPGQPSCSFMALRMEVGMAGDVSSVQASVIEVVTGGSWWVCLVMAMAQGPATACRSWA